MSGGTYSQYGNPYASSGQGGYGAQNPYGAQQNPYGGQNPYGQDSGSYGGGGSYGYQQNPYGAQQSSGYGSTPSRPQPPQAQPSQVSDTSHYGSNAATPVQTRTQGATGGGSSVMSNQDFLSRVEGARGDIRTLTQNVAEIGSVHQRVLNTPDSSAQSQLESLTSQTQVLNTRIKDQIKRLEVDAAKSGGNTTKDSQVRTLKQNFKSQLEDYQRVESTYRERYKDQIGRQYKIVNPNASDSEVREAMDTDWNDQGVFESALKSNRTGAANTVLGTVRARHNDIQKIEQTLIELNQLFQDLAEQVAIQEQPIRNVEDTSAAVVTDTEAGNKQLDKGIKSLRNVRKMKWWLFGIVVLILIVVAIVLAVVFTHNN